MSDLYSVNLLSGEESDFVMSCERPEGYVDNKYDACPDDPTNMCDVISSVDKDQENAIRLYPNPTQDILNLSRDVNWKVLDMYGNTLLIGEGNKIDLSDLGSGVYIVMTASLSHKIIKK